jgi:pyruvoyl-dependent arginine decarboxylase (PvlArgDC)
VKVVDLTRLVRRKTLPYSQFIPKNDLRLDFTLNHGKVVQCIVARNTPGLSYRAAAASRELLFFG